MTRYWAGITSRRWLSSAPISCMAAWQQGQEVLSGAIVSIMRGRCSGRAPRLPRLVAARSRCFFGLALSSSASSAATACSTSSSAKRNWSSLSFSEDRPYWALRATSRRCSSRAQRAMAASRSAITSRTSTRSASGSVGRACGGTSSGPGAVSIMATLHAMLRPRLPTGNRRAPGHYASAFGRGVRGACIRVQSIPDKRAANCAAFIRITPSTIGGHLNAPFSSRFQ